MEAATIAMTPPAYAGSVGMELVTAASTLDKQGSGQW